MNKDWTVIRPCSGAHDLAACGLLSITGSLQHAGLPATSIFDTARPCQDLPAKGGGENGEVIYFKPVQRWSARIVP